VDGQGVSRKQLLEVLEKMDGTEVGDLAQIRWLLKQVGVEWDEDAETLWVKGANDTVAVVRLRSRGAMQKYAKRQGIEVTLSERGEKFATVGQVAQALLAATVGDPVQGASTPAVWKQQHAQRLEYLRGEGD